MNNLQKFIAYASLFAFVTFTAYGIIEFAISDTIKAWSFAASGTSVFFGFAGTAIVSTLIGFGITYYTYKNEDRLSKALKRSE